MSARKWKTWSSRLGLKENASKEKYFHEDFEVAARDFVAGGVPSRSWGLSSRREEEENSQPRRQLVWKERKKKQPNVNVYWVRPPGI